MAIIGCGGPDDGGAQTDGAGPDAADESAAGDGGTDDAANTGVDGVVEDDSSPTWAADIAPMVAGHCRSCHTPDGIAFSMDTYDATRPWAEAMALQTEFGTMPPWHAVPTQECQPPQPFEADARLTAAQIQMFAAWADAGAPQGDPDDAAALPTPEATDLAAPNVTIPTTASVTVEADGSQLDFFHCLSFDPGNTEDVYVDGIALLPGNDKIVHHGVMYIDQSGESASWPDGILRDCNGGSGVSSATNVGGWIPGSMPIVTPDDVGVRLPAGARVVVNMHYHADVLGPQTDDSTALALRWSATPPPWVSEFRIIGAPGLGDSVTGEFVIAPDAVGHEEVIEWTVPEEFESLRVWAVIAHMHKVGVDLKAEIVRPDGDICLVQTPEWDFNWQRVYEYDVPITMAPQVHGGDIIRVRCTYDNVSDNPGVAEALAELGLEQTQDVRVGDGTLDEMCIAGLGLAGQP